MMIVKTLQCYRSVEPSDKTPVYQYKPIQINLERVTTLQLITKNKVTVYFDCDKSEIVSRVYPDIETFLSSESADFYVRKDGTFLPVTTYSTINLESINIEKYFSTSEYDRCVLEPAINITTYPTVTPVASGVEIVFSPLDNSSYRLNSEEALRFAKNIVEAISYADKVSATDLDLDEE